MLYFLLTNVLKIEGTHPKMGQEMREEGWLSSHKEEITNGGAKPKIKWQQW